MVMERQAMFVFRNIQAYSPNHCCYGKAVNISYSERVFVALVSQHEKRMRRVTVFSVACPALPYFSTLSHKRHDFLKKLLNIKISVLISSTSFVRKISHSKKD